MNNIYMNDILCLLWKKMYANVHLNSLNCSKISDVITLTIKFEEITNHDEQDNYEQNLFGAISATLDKAPQSRFTLVAVSSSAGNPSEQAERAANAKNDVSRLISSLISMGMPVDRISVSSLSVANVENTEVRLYAD